MLNFVCEEREMLVWKIRKEKGLDSSDFLMEDFSKWSGMNDEGIIRIAKDQ